MKQTIEQIVGLLEKLKVEAQMASEIVSVQAVSGLELPDIVRDFVDLLMPKLSPYEAAFYVYLLRHSILAEGTPLVRAGRKSLQDGVVRSAFGQGGIISYTKVQETFEALEKIGAIRKQGEPTRDGTLYRVMLPEELEFCQTERQRRLALDQGTQSAEHDVDYYNYRENRLKIYERDNYKCQHCGKQLDRFTSTLDHVTPVSKGGDNSFENLITSCRECNSKKNAKLLGDLMADMELRK